MTSPKQIKCPECNAILKIDDAHYASIINQVRDQLFEDQLNKRVKSEVDNAVIEMDKLLGVSSNIMMGQKIKAGTNNCQLLFDEEIRIRACMYLPRVLCRHHERY